MNQMLIQLNQGRSTLILGYGVTGKALADFCDRQGWNYFIAEDGLKIDRQARSFLGQWSQNPDFLTVTPSTLKDKKICCLFHSPGVSLSHALARQAQKESIPILSELDLASHFIKGELIAVTGTNGKSTTVKLLYSLLCGAGLSTSLKGNYGAPLITAAGEPPPLFHVIEESSYQLEIIHDIHHRFAVCLNVTDDHFDRHKDISDYAQAKSMIIKNSTAADFFIYNHDDPWCRRLAEKSRAKNLPYSLVQKFGEGGLLKGNQMILKTCGQEFVFDSGACALSGMHNLENMLAALLVVLNVKNDGAAVESYKKTLGEFSALPHRMEKFLEKNGIIFIDDSKGTNVGATVMALASLEHNVILIAGGVDKGGDYSPLKGLLRAKVKKLILLGEARQKMQAILKNDAETTVVANMREAVTLTKQHARTGDTVLLSPACSSFDQYKNYHERGQDFQKCVREIF